MSQTPANNAAPTIFVVDDEPMLLELAAAILQPHGYLVRTFRDPRMALNEFKAGKVKPALIITDYEMNSLSANGMDLIRECKQMDPQQKIILVSGTVDEDIYADSPVKPDLFIAKPYEIPHLIASVRRLAAAK